MFRRADPAGDWPARRDRLLAKYLRREAGAHSAYWRETGSSLEAVPVRPFSELAAAGQSLLLRPDVASIYNLGSRRLAARTAWSRLWGHQAKVNRKRIVPGYKPVLWVDAAGSPIAYSQADVDRLGRIGARWLADAGVTEDDVVVSVLPPGPDLAWWQVVEGCRRRPVSAMHLGPSPAVEEVSVLAPSVLVGQPMDVLRMLESGWVRPRLVLAVGRPLDDGLRNRMAAAGHCAVLSAWAPPGVRALWGECAGGESAGLHTWPASEVVELIDPLSGVSVPPGAGGEVVWSALGWRGTVMLRMRTGVFATIDDAACPSCGRVAPRLSVAGAMPAFFAVLDRHPDVLGWQAELRTVGGSEELIVFLAAARSERLDPMLRELDGELSATQYVVLSPAELDRRVAAHNDARVVDLRT